MTSKRRQLRDSVAYLEGSIKFHIETKKALKEQFDDLNKAAVALCQERDDYRDRLIATDKAMNDRLVAAERERDDLRRRLSDIRHSFDRLGEKVYPGVVLSPVVEPFKFPGLTPGIIGGGCTSGPMGGTSFNTELAHNQLDKQSAKEWAGLQ